MFVRFCFFVRFFNCITSRHSSAHSSHFCHRWILETSQEKFIRFGAAAHSVGQRLKVKVAVSTNIQHHSGKDPCFWVQSFFFFFLLYKSNIPSQTHFSVLTCFISSSSLICCFLGSRWWSSGLLVWERSGSGCSTKWREKGDPASSF